MLDVFHSSLICLPFVTWSSRFKKQESRMKKMLSSSLYTCAISVYTLIFMTSVFLYQKSEIKVYDTGMQQSSLWPYQFLCSFTNFLLCMFRLLVAILVKLRLIKMPGDVLVEETSLVEEATEPGPSQASSSATSVSTLNLKAPSTSVVLLYPVSCHFSTLSTPLL